MGDGYPKELGYPLEEWVNSKSETILKLVLEDGAMFLRWMVKAVIFDGDDDKINGEKRSEFHDLGLRACIKQGVLGLGFWRFRGWWWLGELKDHEPR